MKIKEIELTIFYWCFEYCKEVLICFAVFRAVEKEMIYQFNATSTNANGIYCVSKTMLKLMFIEMT